MEKPFGSRGSLTPSAAFKDIEETFNIDRIGFSIKNSIFEVGYDQDSDKERALKIANALIASWSKRNGIKAEYNFNQTWMTQPSEGKSLGINLSEEVPVRERVITTTVTTKGMAYIVRSKTDSYSFANDVEMAKKAEKDETLTLALKYFHDEVIGDERPMIGIHKAIEQIINSLPGKDGNEKRDKLAQIAGCTRQYIDELMSSVQFQRHSVKWLLEWLELRLRQGKSTKIINVEECKARAVNLIDAYANRHLSG